MVTLFFDSDGDITPEVAARYGAKLISMPYILDDQEVHPYEDFTVFDDHAFYQRLRDGAMPTTAALNVEDYKRIFEPEFKAGNDVLYVHFSAAMTCSFDSMDVAVKELQQTYPNAKFYQVDTKGIATLSYSLSIMAGELYQAGKSPEEIVATIEREREHVACYFYADHLSFFRRSGRVSGLAAFFGSILGIHPIITMDISGKMDTCAKILGANQALKGLVNYVEKLGDNIKEHPLYIAHSDALPLAERLAKMLQDRFGSDLKYELVKINPTAGSHCGPDTIGVCFYAKSRA